jgi:PKHD-type hydroxylase
MILSIAGVLQPAELTRLDEGLAQAKFVDGRLTAHGAAARAKNNRQASPENPGLDALQRLVLGALQRSEAFNGFALPLRLMPPMFNRYEPGMSYGDHVDRAVMSGGPAPVRTDLALTLFLSEPDAYDGGELVVSSDFGPQRVKLARGSAVLYPASTLHRVEPVTRGVRLAAVTWVQSMVREHERRQLLAELGQIRRWVEQQSPDAAEGLRLQKIRAQLLRWWADV